MWFVDCWKSPLFLVYGGSQVFLVLELMSKDLRGHLLSFLTPP